MTRATTWLRALGIAAPLAGLFLASRIASGWPAVASGAACIAGCVVVLLVGIRDASAGLDEIGVDEPGPPDSHSTDLAPRIR